MTFAKINGSSIFYTVHGEGTPVVFIHPPTLTSGMFVHQLDDLSSNLKVILFDIPGHGQSSPSTAVLTYRSIADNIKALLDTLKLEKVFLCGYSTGGSVILEFLLTYPERAYGAVLTGAMSEVHDSRLTFRILLGITLSRIKALKPLALSITWSNSDNLRLFWSTYRSAIKGNAQNIMEYYQSSLTYNCTDQLSRIQNPVLLVYGEKDIGFHSYAALLKTHLPNSKLVSIWNADHRIPTNAASTMNQLIADFVKEQISMRVDGDS